MSKAKGIALRSPESAACSGQRVAVLVPCFDEEAAVAAVVADFQRARPQATVYDDNSTDRAVEVARAAGAVVARAPGDEWNRRRM